MLPRIVGRRNLVDANSMMISSFSAALIAGPSLAGILVQVLSAPLALLADAASFVWSAICIASIRHRAPAPVGGRTLGRYIGAGLRLVFGHPVLRGFTLFGATFALCWAVVRAVEIVFLVRTVGLSPAGIGLLSTASGVGAVLGSFTAAPIARRLGTATAVLGGALASTVPGLLVPLTAPGARLACYAVGIGVGSFGVIVFSVVSMTLRQTLCPDELLGRMSATIRFASWGALPLGGLIGGWLGGAIGPRATLWIAAVASVLGVLWLPARRTY